MFWLIARSLFAGRGERQVGPGAMSWMFSSIARPSSVLPAGPSWITLTGLFGFRSPVAYDAGKPARRVLIDAVRDHADRHAGAVDVELRASDVGEHRGLGLVVRLHPGNRYDRLG